MLPPLLLLRGRRERLIPRLSLRLSLAVFPMPPAMLVFPTPLLSPPSPQLALSPTSLLSSLMSFHPLRSLTRSPLLPSSPTLTLLSTARGPLRLTPRLSLALWAIPAMLVFHTLLLFPQLSPPSPLLELSPTPPLSSLMSSLPLRSPTRSL